jgi:uncharacterized protein (DUF2237 family)
MISWQCLHIVLLHPVTPAPCHLLVIQPSGRSCCCIDCWQRQASAGPAGRLLLDAAKSAATEARIGVA